VMGFRSSRLETSRAQATLERPPPHPAAGGRGPKVSFWHAKYNDPSPSLTESSQEPGKRVRFALGNNFLFKRPPNIIDTMRKKEKSTLKRPLKKNEEFQKTLKLDSASNLKCNKDTTSDWEVLFPPQDKVEDDELFRWCLNGIRDYET
jgi:hypothetical protein